MVPEAILEKLEPMLGVWLNNSSMYIVSSWGGGGGKKKGQSPFQ